MYKWWWIARDTGVAIRGASTQVVSINALNVTVATTLVTMGIQTRLEDVTLNISSAADVDISGVDFPANTPQTSKLRTMVVNVTSTATGSPTVLGIRSAGTSTTTDPSSANAIRGCTINVISSGTGINRGILVSAANRFSIRDTNVYISGAGANNIGVETTDAGAIAELKTSTISSSTTNVVQAQHHDIFRKSDINGNGLGNIVLTFTDLFHNDAGVNSFTTTTEPSNIYFGIIGNPQATTRYYLVPGTVPENTLPKTGNTAAWVPQNVFFIPWNQPVIAFTFTLSCTQVLTGNTSFSFNIHKGTAGATPAETPVLTITLAAGQKTNSITTKSIVFSTEDTIACTLVTTGDPAGGSFVGIVGTY